MVRKKKIKKEKSGLRVFARAHGIFTLVLFILYVAFAMMGDFGMLAKDLKAKYIWAANNITLSVNVISMPEQPVVTATPSCVGEQPRVNLTWNATAATDYYDILRGGQMLVGGIVGTSYVDNAVSVETSYAYVVIAHGSLASISSLPVTAVTGKCSTNPPLPDPLCEIVSLDGEPIDFSQQPIKTENQTPKISGTTNIPNAIMLINIYPGPIISSTVNATSNGYWEYSVLGPLPIGIYTFQVTAIDPNDSTRRVTKTVQIEITEKDNDDDDDEDDSCGTGKRIIICHHPGKTSQATMTVAHPEVKGHLGHGDYCGPCKVTTETNVIEEVIVPPTPDSSDSDEDDGDDSEESNSDDVDILTNPEKNLPLLLRIDIENENKIIYSDQDIFARVRLDWKNAKPQRVDFVYEILNEKGQVIAAIARSNSSSLKSLQQIIPLPKDVEYGTYTLRLRTKIDGMYITAQDSYAYKETPIVNLGGSVMFTYSEAVSSIGWFAILCLLLMFFLLIILGREYYLYSHSLRTITEKGLKDNGLISKRKGVSP